jgi:hypothetical protein
MDGVVRRTCVSEVQMVSPEGSKQGLRVCRVEDFGTKITVALTGSDWILHDKGQAYCGVSCVVVE